MTDWHTYEFDWTPSELYFYEDGTQVWTLSISDAHCQSADWPPNPFGVLGSFFDAEVVGSGCQSSECEELNQTMQIDWVAWQAQS
jgi:hypothetical protein